MQLLKTDIHIRKIKTFLFSVQVHNLQGARFCLIFLVQVVSGCQVLFTSTQIEGNESVNILAELGLSQLCKGCGGLHFIIILMSAAVEAPVAENNPPDLESQVENQRELEVAVAR